MKKKTLSMLFVLLFLMSVMNTFGAAAAEESATGRNDAPAEAVAVFAGGSGTSNDPWQIATAEQLDRVRDDLTAHYILTADIDLSDHENWSPIGAFQSLSDAPEDAEVPHPDYALLTDYSMVFQDVVLFDDTVLENIRLGKHGATDEEVLAAARAANCDEFVTKLPQGYATPIGENGAKLSGGERQRISIARALLKNAPIVLLDEATASLDVENETRVQGALSRLLAGKTVLVIAHRMRTVEAADKIVLLDEGAVAEEGRPEDLLADNTSIFHRMAQLQSASALWSI